MVRAQTIAEERRRFSHDLHDLMGHGISTVVLKSELAAKVAESDPRRAKGELEDVIKVSRDLLTNVREVAHGHHRMSLDAELESVVSTMSSLGVEVDADISHDTLDADTSTVLAIVLREGVTNLLTHGRGRRCEIRTRTLNGKVVMILTNECVAGTEGKACGSGLESLADRVSAVNGRFHTARSGDRFILGVEIPQGVFSTPS
ncbi:two-component sensor histidine kinase [Amycolatopsis sp. H6(2020)]|nr:two-component sensor histidine kinase [Amycolatopsis sp. H6(2020)]